MKKCVLCGNSVGQGDRHAKTQCPPKQTNRRFLLKRRAMQKAKRNAEFIPKRGESVAFIRQEGKIKGIKVVGSTQTKKKQ